MTGFQAYGVSGMVGSAAASSSPAVESSIPSASALLALGAAVLVCALVLALVLTPVVGKLARRIKLLDQPSQRKVHPRPIPRIGGIAIFFSFSLAFGGGLFYYRSLTSSPGLGFLSAMGFFVGGALVFLLGLYDDVRGVGPMRKLALQCIAAVLAYFAGIGIHAIVLPGFSMVNLGVFSLPVSVIWFLLIINGINLIDGLDGLAAGVSFFSSAVLFVLCVINDQALAAAGFAALAGSTLGFLRYNFNPATIFMGDGGSYFLGYALAAFSIVGSMKSTASVTILIPILALGLPLMDVLWSAIRRFLLGQRMFKADRDHLHHRLLKLGYTHRRAVLVMYAIAIMMGITSLILVNCSNRQAAILLVAVGGGVVLFIRKLGYIDYLTSEKALGWLRDLTAVMGMERGSRTYLGIQMMILESRSLGETWKNVLVAVRHLQIDHIRLEITTGGMESPVRFSAHPLLSLEEDPQVEDFDPRWMLQIALPLGSDGASLGHLFLAKDIRSAPPELYILRRIEYLRRALVEVLVRLDREQQIGAAIAKAPMAPLVSEYEKRSTVSGLNTKSREPIRQK